MHLFESNFSDAIRGIVYGNLNEKWQTKSSTKLSIGRDFEMSVLTYLRVRKCPLIAAALHLLFFWFWTSFVGFWYFMLINLKKTWKKMQTMSRPHPLNNSATAASTACRMHYILFYWMRKKSQRIDLPVFTHKHPTWKLIRWVLAP